MSPCYQVRCMRYITAQWIILPKDISWMASQVTAIVHMTAVIPEANRDILAG